MTFRELLEDQGVDVDDLLTCKVGESIIAGPLMSGPPAIAIEARLREDGVELEIKVVRH